MLQRLILTFTLVLMFGLGQQGAAAHEISHFADINTSSQQRDKGSHSKLCEKCLSYSGITSALNVSHFAPPLLASSFEHVAFNSANHLSHTLLPYSARGPPSFS